MTRSSSEFLNYSNINKTTLGGVTGDEEVYMELCFMSMTPGNLLFTSFKDIKWFVTKQQVCLKWFVTKQQACIGNQELQGMVLFKKETFNYKKGKEIFLCKTFLQFISYH